MSLVSIVHSVAGAKHYSGFVEKGNLDQLLYLGSFFVQGFIKLLFIVIVSKNWAQVKSIISSCTQLGSNKMRRRQVRWLRTFSFE